MTQEPNIFPYIARLLQGEEVGGGRKVIYFNYDEDKRYKTIK